MINKSKTSKAWCWKVAAFLPLLALLLMAFGRRDESERRSLHEKFLSPALAFAEQDKPSNQMVTDTTERKVFVTADVMPRYPGGAKELFHFIVSNIKYPEKAVTEKIEGDVVIRFIVTKEGKTENVTVIKGANYLLDDEAVRVTKLITGWHPGMNKGMKVDVWYSIGLKFALPGNVFPR